MELKNQNVKDSEVIDVRSSMDDDMPGDGFYDESSGGNKKTPKGAKSSSKTPILDTYSKDLTLMAQEGKLDPIVGREKEIERVSQILSRRKKNNPILIGEPGVGKSAIGEGLALKIVEKKVSRILFNKRIVLLDIASMVAGTKYRGQFEERIKALMTEIEDQPDIILFIDEIHTIIGAGSSTGSLDASNMFKPALARGEMQIVGATTIDEYRKHIEKDGALERRFQKVIVEPTSPEETIEIINNIKDKYENHHNVSYTPEAIEACVTLTERYITDRHLPDKAIDALDEAGARVHISNIDVPQVILDIEEQVEEIKDRKMDVVRMQKYEEAAKLRDSEKKLLAKLANEREKWEEFCNNNKQPVNEDDVAAVVAMVTGIPVSKVNASENVKLAKMYDAISSKVIGQNEAVEKVVKAIQRGRVGMKDPNKPIFSGMLIGNSGVGKTELAKQIAKYMFDSEDALIRLDMSEYMDKTTSTKIQGSAPGYVGYEDANILDKIRRRPYSVILFDEIEKAHPDIFNLFLQVLDDGHMTDSHGRKVSFKNSIILMTSNVGTRIAKEHGAGIGFSTIDSKARKADRIKGILEKELKKAFAPEFINRLDDIIYFKDLGEDEISDILQLELSKTIRRAKEIGYDLTVGEKLMKHLTVAGYDPEYGARPMKRAIQVWIDDFVTGYIIEKNPKEGSKLHIEYDEKKEESKVTLKRGSSTTKRA